MNEISELNAVILREAGAKLPEGGLFLSRSRGLEETTFPTELLNQIDGLRNNLARCLPDDFNYALFVGCASPSFSVTYDDGPNTSSSRGHVWKNDVSIFSQLETLDWNEERGWAISNGQIFDSIGESAKHLPVRLPLTKHFQKLCGDEMDSFVKRWRADASKIHVLLLSEEGISEQRFDTLGRFNMELPNMMTCQYHVVTVVADGKPLPARKIDKLKIAALKMLEDMPISHAKASGKLVFF